MPLQSGVYYLRNVQSETLLDVSGTDGKSIIAQPIHGGKNQQWEVGKLGSRGWFIRNLCGAYLTVEGIGNHIPLVGNEFPVAWDLRIEPQEGEDAYGICWPSTAFSADLHIETSGNRNPVKFCERYPEGRNQIWRFVRCPDENQITTTVINTGGTEATATTVATITTTTTTKVVLTRNGVELRVVET